MRVVLTQHVLDLTPGLSAWMLALAYQHTQATVCDFYEWTGRFFSTRIEFHTIEKNKGGLGGWGKGG